MPIPVLRYTLSVCLILLCTFSPYSQSPNSSSMVYDLVFVGYDSHIGQNQREKIGVLTTVDIFEGYRFGIINKLPNNRDWESYNNNDLVTVSFTVKSGVEFKKGTLFEIYNNNGTILIKNNEVDVTNSFEPITLTGSNNKLIEQSGTFLTLHSGYFTKSEILLGSVLDIISINVMDTELSSLILPASLQNKNILTNGTLNDGGGMVDVGDCRLCDLIQIILDPENWINFPNTQADDVDLSDFNLEDCAEVDCEGEIQIDNSDGCKISVTDYPCERETATYEWQEYVNGIYVTIASGNGPEVPDLNIDKNGDYRLILVCDDGCEYSQDFSSDCVPDICEATLTVVQDDCTLTATVTGCTDPIYNWYYIGAGNSISDAGNTSTITAETDNTYYVEVDGCCKSLKSDFYSAKGCLICECSQQLVAEGCTILATEDECEGYIDLWEFSISGDYGTWIPINFHGLEYEATENGYYRRSLSKNGCVDIVDEVEVDCIIDCANFNAHVNVDKNCNLVIDYFGCSEVIDVDISFAEATSNQDCQSGGLSYSPGGGSVINNIDNGNSGVISINPDYNNVCYNITLTCANGCQVTVYYYSGNCCSSSLAITEEEDCTISVGEIPCDGTFDYAWYLEGVIFEAGTATTLPNFVPPIDGEYQLIIECDGCEHNSNIINIECLDPPCSTTVIISPDGCLLTAVIEECPDGLVQWQKWNGSIYEDIPGANEETYLSMEDTDYKLVVTNCENCEDEEPLSFTYTTMGCDDMCTCETEVFLDPENCVLTSSNSDCMNISNQSWWQSNDNGQTWFFLFDATDPMSYVPMQNAWYKKVIKFNDGCPDEEDIEIVNCLEDCSSSLDVTLEITSECYLKATWTGCVDYESNGFGWYFASSNEQNCGGNSNFPLSQPSGGDIIELENNPIDGSGYLIIDPTKGEGCYFFNFQCMGCETLQKSIEWAPCCEDEPFIDDNYIDEEVCDYCWANQNPQEITDINVNLPNGDNINLLDSPEFNFSYCHITSCESTIADLVNDINTWFLNNGYLGEAFIGPAPIGCKFDALFHIVDSNVEFIDGFVIEDDAPPSFPFEESDCEFINGSLLTVENECVGATYMWSTGENTESIIVDNSTDYTVTVTCPDGCSYDVYYGNPSIEEITNSNIQEIQDHNATIGKNTNTGFDINKSELTANQLNSITIYPNPTRANFFLETLTPIGDNMKVSIFNSHGQFIKSNQFFKNENGKFKVDTNTLLDGIYFIHTEIDGKVVSIDKLSIIK